MWPYRTWLSGTTGPLLNIEICIISFKESVTKRPILEKHDPSILPEIILSKDWNFCRLVKSHFSFNILWLLILYIFCFSVLWTYLNIVLYSYCKTLREGGNITNADGVEYFAPTEQIVGKSVPRGAPSQYNIQPSYFAAAPYPTQSYSQAPPAYDEATHPNSAYANSSFPSTNQ